MKIETAALKEKSRTVAGWTAIAIGAIVLTAGWIGISGQTIVAKQLPYLISGGIGGFAFLAGGIGLLIAEDLRSERARIGRLESELLEVRDLLRAMVESRGTKAG